MTPSRSRRLAWSIAGTAVAMTVCGVAVDIVIGTFESVLYGLISGIAVAFATAGALVASRHPRNAVGWTFLGIALSTGIANLAGTLVEYRLRDGPDDSAIVGLAAAYSDVSWVPFVLVPATFVLLLFPDGRLPSRRWRAVASCAGVGIMGVFISGLVGPEPIADYPTVEKPYVIDGPVMEALTGLAYLLLLIGLVGSVASVVVRFRHAGRVQRQQIKWLAMAGAVVGVTFPVMGVALYDVVGEQVADGTIMVTVLGLPVAAGIAILRHRLYDIDVVINRALVYGALTATLAGAYLGGVLLLQLALSPLTASNGLAIAVSTLAVAALFQPARRRIQAAVDRRFYRRKYDAARTLERFGARLRDEVDLDALAIELRAVVADTMQPAHVSLWLRVPEGSGPPNDRRASAGARPSSRAAI
ncbi:MAG TPA: hypothetical protein VGV90_11895 [Solirubrobacteraceae bacterium]|nr:hypothetical protein [Solirubrobacteraceae bacterium]